MDKCDIYDEIPQLEGEIMKMDQENRVAEIKAKAYINDFVNDIRKLDRKDIIRESRPQRIKLSFRYRIKRFFDKINNTLT